jgi:23S rRNA (cytidine1920-2'-O)/16S rRNA (cytidine1409-2'-O)-methyltransferase
MKLLKEGGWVLQVLKRDKVKDTEPFLNLLESKGLKIDQVIPPEKKEAYVMASKSS